MNFDNEAKCMVAPTDIDGNNSNQHLSLFLFHHINTESNSVDLEVWSSDGGVDNDNENTMWNMRLIHI